MFRPGGARRLLAQILALFARMMAAVEEIQDPD